MTLLRNPFLDVTQYLPLDELSCVGRFETCFSEPTLKGSVNGKKAQRMGRCRPFHEFSGTIRPYWTGR